MKRRGIRWKYAVVAWSLILVGGYIFYMARGWGRAASQPTTRVLRGSKFAPVYESAPNAEEHLFPSSKHARIGPNILYGDGSVTFDKNPFVTDATTRETSASTTRP